MSNRSNISRLPKNIKSQVDKALANGATIDQIVEKLKECNVEISRSSIGRYTQKARSDVIAKINESLELSEAMGAGLSLNSQNKQHQHILSLLNVLMQKMAFDAVHNDEDLTTKDLAMLGRAVKDAILSANKLEDVKELARKQAMEEAAQKAADVLNEKLSEKKGSDILKALKTAYGVD